MRDKLLISTAIVLAGLAYASAQNAPSGGPSEKAPSGAMQGSQSGGAQQQAPSRGKQGTQRNQDAGKGSGRAQGQDDRTVGQREGNQGKGKQAQPKPEQGQKAQTTGQGQREDGKGKQAQPKSKSGQGKQTTGQGQREEGKGKQAQPKPKPDQRKQTTGQGQRNQGKDKQAQPKTGKDQTTGQGAQRQGQQGQQRSMGQRDQAQGQARGRIELNEQQQTRIRQTVLARSDLPRLTSVNFAVRVGTVVPARVRAIPVTEEIIAIRPAFRNHLFFVVRDEIIILDRSRRIVAMIPVESSRTTVGVRGSSGRAGSVSLSVTEIREVQQVLVDQGFSVEVDGVLGPRTRQALIAFQRREGLQPTGRIDSQTVTKLGVSIKTNEQGQSVTTGQGGQGNGAQQSQPGQQGQQSPAMRGQQQNGKSGAMPRSSGKQNQPASGDDGQPSTTGQGGSSQQQPPMDRGATGTQGKSGSPPAKQAPQRGNGGGSAPMQGGQGQSK